MQAVTSGGSHTGATPNVGLHREGRSFPKTTNQMLANYFAILFALLVCSPKSHNGKFNTPYSKRPIRRRTSTIRKTINFRAT